ncbi:MAG: pirin family protein [Thermoproteota archaeon]|nr:pirin family protein [Thermoproteota archaeon]
MSERVDNTLSFRTVKKIINSITTTEGEGFTVHRSFPNGLMSDLDPFLLLDEMGPMDLEPGEAKGAPDHPHRGFETITYMLSGRFEHKDSQGNWGKLNPGDVQWMTAGSGVIHSEMPEAEFIRQGGKLHGFQLWINLPKKDKMTKPNYQDIPSSKLPVVPLPGGQGSIKVIAGRFYETNSVIDTKTSIQYMHIILEPGARVDIPMDIKFNAFAYVVAGEGLFEEKEDSRAVRGQLVIFNGDGESVYVKASEFTPEPLQVLLIAGIPLNEPIARYGPFVMNTKQEVYQAIEDYRNGKLGILAH